MTTWKITYKYTPIEYRIVRGNLTRVEDEVVNLIDMGIGWDLNGELHMVDVDGTTIAVQGMVRYKKEAI